MFKHPEEALFKPGEALPVLPPCEHYAGSRDFISKALGLQKTIGQVFDVTCDCEDGAPFGAEEAHARMIAEVVTSPVNAYGMVGLRVHDYESKFWKRDVEIVLGQAAEKLAYITIPKTTSVEQLKEMIFYINTVCADKNVPPKIPIHVLIETRSALSAVREIAALDQVQVLDFGLLDFISDHQGAIPFNAARSPGQFEHPLVQYAKTQIATAALAYGKIPSHNVTIDLKNEKQVFADARYAREKLGYLRMWSIHPLQIEPIVQAMAPSYTEMENAAAILIQAQDKDWGPLRYEDELYDRASYRYFWAQLKYAKASGIALPEAAISRFFPRS